MDVKCGVMKIPISLKKYIHNSFLVYQNCLIICQYMRTRTVPTTNHYKTENDRSVIGLEYGKVISINLKLKFSQYSSIHTNYIIPHCTTLQYNHNI